MKTDLEHRRDSRSKVVSFRISGAEHASALALCRIYGYSGMSGLARSAFLAFKPRAEVNAQKKNDSLIQHPGIEYYQLRTLLAELHHLISSLQGLQETLPEKPEE